MLHKLAGNLELPKLTFQGIRRTIATLAQKKGTVKDVQGVLRHSRTATTADVYLQEISASVQATVNSIHRELKAKSKPSAGGEKKFLAKKGRHAAIPAKDGAAKIATADREKRVGKLVVSEPASKNVLGICYQTGGGSCCKLLILWWTWSGSEYSGY